MSVKTLPWLCTGVYSAELHGSCVERFSDRKVVSRQSRGRNVEMNSVLCSPPLWTTFLCGGRCKQCVQSSSWTVCFCKLLVAPYHIHLNLCGLQQDLWFWSVVCGCLHAPSNINRGAIICMNVSIFRTGMSASCLFAVQSVFTNTVL